MGIEVHCIVKQRIKNLYWTVNINAKFYFRHVACFQRILLHYFWFSDLKTTLYIYIGLDPIKKKPAKICIIYKVDNIKR